MCAVTFDASDMQQSGMKHVLFGLVFFSSSDDGNFFIWDRHSGIIHSVFQADELIVNCVQPHPYICMLATSGIDHEVRLWSPQSPEKPAVRRTTVVDSIVHDNQTHMQIDPFDSIAPDQAICRAS